MVHTEAKAITYWMDYLAGELSEEEKGELFAYLSQHPELQKELQAEELIWQRMESFTVPEPSSNMDERFGSMLQGYMAANERNAAINWWPVLQDWVARSWRVGLASLVIGAIFGWILIPRDDQAPELAALSQEMVEMKKMMMLTLIEQPKAQERIQAVSLVNELPDVDLRVIDILKKTLNEDPNLNVRLAALESLTKYWDNPDARTALVTSIAHQDSPLIQVAIADAMLALRERKSIDEFEKLLTNPALDEGVKLKLESTVQQLKQI